MANQGRAAEWDWVPIPRIRKVRAMCPTNRKTPYRPGPSGSRSFEAFLRATWPRRAAAPRGGEGAHRPVEARKQGSRRSSPLPATRWNDPGRRTGKAVWARNRRGGREGICGARKGGPPSIPLHSRPEDGDRLTDLRSFTRDVMGQMEQDLGTELEWVAVDHFNTSHPHSHVVIRGKDEAGNDIIIAQDYITDGVRLRAQERATLELGPESELELRQKLSAEITAERFTRIDRAMIAEAQESVLDLRPEAGQFAPILITRSASAVYRPCGVTASRQRSSQVRGLYRKS